MTAYCFSSAEEGHSKLQNLGVIASQRRTLYFWVIINAINIFQLIPQTEIAHRCVHVLINKTFSLGCWQERHLSCTCGRLSYSSKSNGLRTCTNNFAHLDFAALCTAASICITTTKKAGTKIPRGVPCFISLLFSAYGRPESFIMSESYKWPTFAEMK